MLPNYSFPIKSVIYTNSENSEVKVIYEDDTFNYADPTDQQVLSWININENVISDYQSPQEDADLDRTQPGYVGLQ
jgi:hypothetical protein